jgi:hypothetical protein
MASSRSQSKKRVENRFESLSDVAQLGDTFKDSLVNDIGIGGANDFLSMIGIDAPTEQKHADNQNGEVEVFNAKVTKEKISKTETRIEAAIDYHREIVRAGENASKQEIHAFKSQIEQIKAELVSLAKSAKVLQLEVASVAVEQAPENAGTYHQHFFEWMLNMLRAARERVETSEAWMSAQKNKAGKKGYWGMFKKHGTSFALSNERGVATQVG